MGISIGLVGLGAFGSQFAPLFKGHPLVDRIALCDREPDRLARFADDPCFQGKFDRKDGYTSLEDICRADLDAVVLITQYWLHAPQALQVMRSGKHVYSAVPVISLPDVNEILEWCDKIIDTSLKTGMRYMLGETTYYRPQTMYCRRKAAEGAFGDFVYTEGDYIHPFDWPESDLREVEKKRLASKAGKEWLEVRSVYEEKGIKESPMTYPTHSVSGPMSVMKAHAEKVSAFGYKNLSMDPHFAHHQFSNITALYQMSNGSQMRICEHRETTLPPGEVFESETFRVFGTKGSFRENHWGDRESSIGLTVDQMSDPLPDEVLDAYRRELGEDDMLGGHGGSHGYLVHEFVDSVASERMPSINAWEAARYMSAGAAAHQSALKGGELTEVVDWGDAPE